MAESVDDSKGRLDELLECHPEIGRLVLSIADRALGLIDKTRAESGEEAAGKISSGIQMVVKGVHDELPERAVRALDEEEATDAASKKADLLRVGAQEFAQLVGTKYENGRRPLDIDVNGVMAMAADGKVILRLPVVGEMKSHGGFSGCTADGVSVEVEMRENCVEVKLDPVELPSSNITRTFLAEEMKRAAKSGGDEKYRRIGTLSLGQIMKLEMNGNIKVVRRPFGDEHPRAMELMRLCTRDKMNFICLVTGGAGDEDVKIEVYFPRG